MKSLITELEDAIRREARRAKAHGSSPYTYWAKDRLAFIRLAAWLMTVVETGDANAAAQEKDPGTTG